MVAAGVFLLCDDNDSVAFDDDVAVVEEDEKVMWFSRVLELLSLLLLSPSPDASIVSGRTLRATILLGVKMSMVVPCPNWPWLFLL